MTIAQQLEAFAQGIEVQQSWAPYMNTELYNTIKPFADAAGLALPKPNPADAFDSVFRMSPPGWRRAMQELDVTPGQRKATCNLSLWGVAPDTEGLKYEVYPLVLCNTMLLALIVATARAWSYMAARHGL